MRTKFFTCHDRSDIVFYAALLTLPIDGTTVGLYAPFWTPISPWLLLLYVCLNWRELPSVLRHFRNAALLLPLLICLSIPGWLMFGIHTAALLTSLFAVLCAVASVFALDIALRGKRLPWSDMIRVVLVAYWFAFAVGVLQWLSIVCDWRMVQDYFVHLMYRSYISTASTWGASGGRPQFLFAEPSYIGMHLFGVLLPLMWLMRLRDSIYAKRLRTLIVVFAVGAMLMGAGVRIILDSVIACLIAVIESTRWREVRRRHRGAILVIATLLVGGLYLLANNRIAGIVNHGVSGDGSFYARIWQSLGPLCGLLKHPWTLLTGYGAGNIAEATHAGAGLATNALTASGLDASNVSAWYAGINADTVWTMSAYTSFVVEFGIIGLTAVLAAVIRGLLRCKNAMSETAPRTAPALDTMLSNTLTMSGVLLVSRKTLVCWIILVTYLYVQFEGYAFIALPMLIWVMNMKKRRM